MSKTTQLRTYSRSVFVHKIPLLCQVTVTWWTNRCIPRHGERAFCNNGFLAAPFEVLKKITTFVCENRRVRTQNNGVKVGDERLVWPFTSLADSLIQSRS